MPKLKLSTKYVESIDPPAKGRELHYDTKVAGLAVSVTANDARTWVLYTRFPGPTGPTPSKRALGAAPRPNVTVTGQLSLDEARRKAEAWLSQIANGMDPAEQKKRERAAAKLERDATFAAVAEEFIRLRLPRQRRGRSVENDLRRNAMAKWGDRPIGSIRRHDVVALIESLSDRPAQAHNSLTNLKVLFGWAITRGSWGLEYAPTDRLKPAQVIAPKVFRQRVLSDPELRALWRAAEAEGYPFGPAVQLLLLTGCRRGEVLGARWREFHPSLVKLLRGRGDQPIDWGQVDDATKVLTIPPERFKSGSSHLVALSDAACRLLETLPLFRGEYLFTTTGGAKPISGLSVPKRRLDRLMAAELGGELPGWVLHDLRRTVRTRLSSLQVPDVVAEMVVGHAKRGLQRVYDQHSYMPEMRAALTQWAARLEMIVDPPQGGGNVVALRAAG